MNDGYGLTQSDLFASLDPIGSALRTSLASLLCEIRGVCSVTWRMRATTCGQWCWVPMMSARHIEGNECGSLAWTTPQAFDKNGSEVQFANLAQRLTKGGCKSLARDVVENNDAWATPTSRDWRSTAASDATMTKNSRPLSEKVGSGPQDQESDSTSGSQVDWSTPQARDEHGHTKRGGDRSSELLLPGQAGVSKTGALHSRWVATLMGLPATWCDLPADTIASLSAR